MPVVCILCLIIIIYPIHPPPISLVPEPSCEVHMVKIISSETEKYMIVVVQPMSEMTCGSSEELLV